ncbi:MAG: hypothetical protein HRT88_17755 [Lentisphaeraceae bacterium]|nr:hypothetical protein [Lentisphaeraceae bacterium]
MRKLLRSTSIDLTIGPKPLLIVSCLTVSADFSELNDEVSSSVDGVFAIATTIAAGCTSPSFLNKLPSPGSLG